MLDQLRAMGVFACVVEKSSFSGAARELGITTSAVSQQIRSLEQEMEVTLLHRSTRKLSLTEVGQAFFHSCQEMLAAAERGKVRINELRDDLVGELRISTIPSLAADHLIPALSQWMAAHRGLSVDIQTEHAEQSLVSGRIDVAISLGANPTDNTQEYVTPLAEIEQVLVASPIYINQAMPICKPEDLQQHELLPVSLIKNSQSFDFEHQHLAQKVHVTMPARLSTNSVLVAKTMCLQGHGIARLPYSDVQKELMKGSLVEVLPEWKLPRLSLTAVTMKTEQQPIKVERCLDVLKQYFAQLPKGRVQYN